YAESVFAQGTAGPAIAALHRAFNALGLGRLPVTPRGWVGLTLRELGRQIVHRLLPARWTLARAARRPRLAEGARSANALGYADLVAARGEFLGTMLRAANLADGGAAQGERALAYSALGSILGTLGLWRPARGFFAIARRAVGSSTAMAGRTLLAV